ncbi:MAG: glycoside hydrolase family 16 protein [Coriobacteriia bacterium]|nr:glycoside hydrolase family 16 protein [Coriobacteriia bacterium]
MRVHWAIGASALIVVLLLGTTSAALAAPAPHLVFADEFEHGLDPATWVQLTPWNTTYSTGELESYRPDNVAVAGGELRLASRKDSSGAPYTSGIVTSLARDRFSYGYFEIRATLPKGRGIFPAFWLTNGDSLEIDAMEMLGDVPSREYMTLHQHNQVVFQRAVDGPDLSEGYHTFGVDWQPTYVRWYVDGQLRAEYAHPVPHDPLWICLDTAIGGKWAGAPDASTHFPQYFDIDYVRVWNQMPHDAAQVASALANYAATAQAAALSSRYGQMLAEPSIESAQTVLFYPGLRSPRYVRGARAWEAASN